jgi:hypothetical protein
MVTAIRCFSPSKMGENDSDSTRVPESETIAIQWEQSSEWEDRLSLRERFGEDSELGFGESKKDRCVNVVRVRQRQIHWNKLKIK